MEISFSGENTGLHWPQQFTKLLLNMLHGLMAAPALAMVYFSLDRHHHHKLLKIFCLWMGRKVGVIFHITLQ